MMKRFLALGALVLTHVAIAAPPDFSTLDRDGNKLINQKEAAQFPPLAERFRDIDANNDGYIDRVEYMRRAPALRLRD